MMEKTFYLSPIGLIEIRGSEKGISMVSFAANVDTVIENPPSLRDCVSQLNDYFNKKRKKFELEFDLEGTEFQRKVWKELLKIPYGETRSYNYIAKKLGDQEAVRAVGHANGKNPLAVIIPCHRVIGSDGKLVGYGGGLWRKRWLLDFENKDKQTELFI
jgi:methylated-DNA-[protein]-cysteine S-methyltransferase